MNHENCVRCFELEDVVGSHPLSFVMAIFVILPLEALEIYQSKRYW